MDVEWPGFLPERWKKVLLALLVLSDSQKNKTYLETYYNCNDCTIATY